MNFELSEEQNSLAKVASEFAASELAPNAARWDSDGEFPRDAVNKASQLGFSGLYVSADLGGKGLSRLDSTLVLEELAAGCTSVAAYLAIHNMAAWLVASESRTAALSEWAKKLASGQALASYCLSEPASGSDVASITLDAKKDGSNYVLNGEKAFVTGAGVSDVLLVIAKTGEGSNGLSAFLVPADSAGIVLGDEKKKMGWNALPLRSVTFENVTVSEDLRLGNEGDGFRIALTGIDGKRINIGICSIGTAQAALNTARDYMNSRVQFGKPIASLQALQFKLSDMATELVAARQMIRYAATKLDASDANANVYCAMAKQTATDVGYKICNEALQLHGGYGYLNELPLERYLRDTRAHQILGGTNEVMRVIVSRHVLDEAVVGANDEL